MTPISLQDSLVAFAGGGILGLLFFGGLLLTVDKFIHHQWRELVLVASFVLRAAVVMGGFYLLAEGQFMRAIIALTGFIVVRTMLMAIVRPKGPAGRERRPILPMKLTEISPDQQVFFESGVFKLNATIVFTWMVMALLVGGSWLVTRKLSSTRRISRWQNFLEIAVTFVAGQIREVTGAEGRRYLPFIGSLFLFVALCNVLMIVPGYVPPTASLSTTVALALCVFVAVPFFGITRDGLKSYLARYVQPTVFMLPFNVIGELSRTLALAVRLFGNMMSGTKIAAILLAITPLIFPAVMNAFGLLTGMVQAYIFSILALVYIASGGSADAPDRPAET